MGIYWGPYPLLKGSNRGGPKQLGAHHPKGTSNFPYESYIQYQFPPGNEHRTHIPPFTGSSENHRLKSTVPILKGICDPSQEGSNISFQISSYIHHFIATRCDPVPMKIQPPLRVVDLPRKIQDAQPWFHQYLDHFRSSLVPSVADCFRRCFSGTNLQPTPTLVNDPQSPVDQTSRGWSLG